MDWFARSPRGKWRSHAMKFLNLILSIFFGTFMVTSRDAKSQKEVM